MINNDNNNDVGKINAAITIGIFYGLWLLLIKRVSYIFAQLA